jgi:hypothetical protein
MNRIIAILKNSHFPKKAKLKSSPITRIRIFLAGMSKNRIVPNPIYINPQKHRSSAPVPTPTKETPSAGVAPTEKLWFPHVGFGLKSVQLPLKMLVILAGIWLNLVNSARAEPFPSLPTSNAPTDALRGSQILFNAPPPPKQGTPSGRSQGGASRGPCQDYEDLTALVPTTDGVVWGKTTRQHPSFWFYLPHPLTAETPIEFIVQDATDNYVYQTHVTVPNTPAGLIRFEVDPQGQSLQPNQLYTWTLVIYCNPTQPTQSVFVNGILQRSLPNSELQAKLATAEALERAKLYAAHGIWYDALHILAQQYQSQPYSDRVSTAWADLLQQVGLDTSIDKPFTSCCGSY